MVNLWEPVQPRRPSIGDLAVVTVVIAGVVLISGMPSLPDSTSTANRADVDAVPSPASDVETSRGAAAPPAAISPILRTRVIQGRCHGDPRNVHGAAAAAGGTSDAPVAAVGRGASSAGDADIHGYATYPDHALHVIYLEALWDRHAGARIRAADEWRATVTVQRGGDTSPADLAVQYWYTDLPGACLEVTPSGGPTGTTTFAVAVRDVARLQTHRSYTTEVHFASAHDLAGTPWTYHEELVIPVDGRSRSARTSYRAGEVGTCSGCFVTWGGTARRPQAHAAVTTPPPGVRR